MKIVFDKKEIKAVKGFMGEMNGMQLEILKSMLPEGHEVKLENYSFIDLIMGIESKIFSAKLDFNGLTLEINPEFTVDFLTIYGKAINASVPGVIAIVKAVSTLQEEVVEFGEKWL
jgi:hypothetical protein